MPGKAFGEVWRLWDSVATLSPGVKPTGLT